MAIDANDTDQRPQFFSDGNDFASKAELFANKTVFCVTDVEEKDGKYGKKWHIQIHCEGADELQTITFSQSDPTRSKREQEFRMLAAHPEYLPSHACRLKMWNYEGKSGYRIAARNGGGPCPCKPEVKDIDPFSPEFDELPIPAEIKP